MSFTFNGFRVLPGRGLIAGIVVILMMALGLAYSVSTALKNAEKVGHLQRALEASQADVEALKGVVTTQRTQAVDQAKESAKTQEALRRAETRIRNAGGSLGSGPERLRNKRDEAQRILKGTTAPSTSSVP